MPKCVDGLESRILRLATGKCFLLPAMRLSEIDFVAGLQVPDVGGKPWRGCSGPMAP